MSSDATKAIWTRVFSLVEMLSRWIVGGVFLYAGGQKILDPDGFAKIIYGYGILPGGWVNITAIVLPWVECIAGGALVIGVWPASSSGVISGLLSFFMVAIIYNIMRGYTFDCGCFGGSGEPSGWGTVVRDIALFIPGAMILLFRGKRYLCVYTGGE